MTMGQAQMGSLTDTHENAADGIPLQEKLKRASHTCSTLTNLFEESLSSFWQAPAKLRFFSISPKTQYFWRLEDFFASQVALSNEASIQLRLSKNMCQALLCDSLGEDSQHTFSLKSLTKFEKHLLTESTKDILSHVAVHLLRQKDSLTPDDELLHMIWLISLDGDDSDEEKEVGKLVLSIPLSLLDALNTLVPDQNTPSSKVITDETLFHARSIAHLYAGHTQVRLDDIQNLEVDDIMVLEKSSTNQLYLIEPQSRTHIPFTANLLNIETIEVNTDMDETTVTAAQPPGKTLWDNLMIDVHAEFDPTQLPLNELKQMSEGLIVEVADLDKSQLRLHVEGKTVALGELVIVGNKLGVRIKEIIPEDAIQNMSDEHTPLATQAPPDTQEAPQPTAEQQQPQPEAAPQEQTQQPAAAADSLPEDNDDALFEDEWDI